MFKKIILSVAIMMAGVLSLSAQSGNKHFYVDAGAGVNAMYDARKVGGWGFGSEIAFGYAFLPQGSIRVGVQLGTGSALPGENQWFAAENPYFRGAVFVDLLWDIINTVNEDYAYNFYHFQPYLHLQETFGVKDGKTARSFTPGAGLRQTFSLSESIDIVWDMNAVIAGESSWKGADGFMVFGQAVVGLSYKF